MFKENILAEVTRGNIVESLHRGSVAVVDNQGRLLASVGNPDFKTFLRSSAKPLQAVPVVESGAAENYKLSLDELAVIMGSHSGEKQHQEAVLGILEKIGLDKSYLKCGIHPPFNKKTRDELKAEGKKPEEIHAACSGKHSGMLTLTQFDKDSLDDYYKIEHHTQEEMLKTVADFAEMSPCDVEIGIDGCGVPVFGMPLRNMALAYANFSRPDKFSEKRKKACFILHEAMEKYPELIAGSDRFTSKLLKHFSEFLVAKDGAEGIFCYGLKDRGIGVAIKIEDGSARALNAVVLKTLLDLEIIGQEDLKDFQKEFSPEVKNFRGEVIGEIKPVLSLKIEE